MLLSVGIMGKLELQFRYSLDASDDERKCRSKRVDSSPLRTGRLYPQEYPGTYF